MEEPQSRLVLENYIGGKFVPCRSHIDSYDPSTGEVYCRVPDSGQEEVGDPGTDPVTPRWTPLLHLIRRSAGVEGQPVF